MQGQGEFVYHTCRKTNNYEVQIIKCQSVKFTLVSAEYTCNDANCSSLHFKCWVNLTNMSGYSPFEVKIQKYRQEFFQRR